MLDVVYRIPFLGELVFGLVIAVLGMLERVLPDGPLEVNIVGYLLKLTGDTWRGEEMKSLLFKEKPAPPSTE